MTRTLYDSVTVGDIPTDAKMVAVYVDGMFANEAKVKARCPHAHIVRITVTGGTTAAEVIDCEKGDASPSGAAAWAKRKVGIGQAPTIYCSRSAWADVKAAVAAVGLKPAQVSYWIADYGVNASIGSSPTVPPGAVAKQYRNTKKPNLDYSVVCDYWPGVDPRPLPRKPAAQPVKAAAVTPPKPVAKPAAKKANPAPKVPAKVPPKLEPGSLVINPRQIAALKHHGLWALLLRILKRIAR